MDNKQKALLKYKLEYEGELTTYSNLKELIINIKDIADLGNSYNDYMVLIDEEAEQMAEEYIKDTVWAFNKSFLNCHSECIAEIPEEAFRVIQEQCESSNNAILKMIDDIDYFIEDAISCDGRGHFLNTYDGEEYEITVDKDLYFVYRLN